MDIDRADDDQNGESEANQDDPDSEVGAMEFRLFASQDLPTVITLNMKEPEIVHVHHERPELDESPGSLRIQQITEAVIDATTILGQAQAPWVSFYATLP